MTPVFSFGKTTILHCGAGATTLGVFQRNGSGVRCVHLATETFSIVPLGEDGWLERTAAALQVLNATRRWTGPVVLVLPAHLTLTKQIKVPSVEPAKRAQVIRFEAEQAVPYDLAEVIWDCVPAGAHNTGEDLLLVAARKGLVEGLCMAVQRVGFYPARILPLALVSMASFRLARPADLHPALLLNLDGPATTMLQVDGTRIAVRTLAVGGTALKPPSTESQPDGSTGGAWAAIPEAILVPGNDQIEMFAARLAQEITRSLLHFGREGGMASPEHVFLTGAGARQAGLDAMLAVRLKLPVTRFTAKGVVAILPGVHLVEPGLSVLADLSGAAAIALLPGQPAVDFLPPALRRRMSLRRRQPCLIAAALLVSLTLVPPILHYRQVAATVRAKVVALEKYLAPLRTREVRLRATFGQLQQLQDQISRLETVQARRAAWLQLFAAVQERLVQVEDVWLEQVQMIPPVESNPLKLALTGRMLERENPTAPDRSETNSRVKQLLAGLAGLPQVAAVESERIDHSQPGLLRFDFILVSNPAHPL